jgi:hypothetical protein
MIIEKKVDKGSFELILKGVKKYEVRLNEFKCEPGDTLVLKEKDSKTNKLTGREVSRKITLVDKTFLTNGYYPMEEILKKGLQIISFE